MDLLYAILVALGCNYSQASLNTAPTNESEYEMVQYATYIRDNNLYHITSEEGVVIDVSVNPHW